MRRAAPDDPTLLLPAGSGRRGADPGARRAAGARYGQPAARGFPRGVWSSIGGLGALALLGALAPSGADASRFSALIPGLGPLPLLAASASLGALGALSGIRRLWRGGAPLRAVITLALGACPLLLAAGLLMLRIALSAP